MDSPFAVPDLATTITSEVLQIFLVVLSFLQSILDFLTPPAVRTLTEAGTLTFVKFNQGVCLSLVQNGLAAWIQVPYPGYFPQASVLSNPQETKHSLHFPGAL